MNPKKPLISVIIPTYNNELYIESAVTSILNQTFEDFELIIIDDNSSDNTWDIVQKIAKQDSRIVLVRNKENLKTAGSRNKGVRLAKADIIAMMDHDDWSYPERLNLQYDYLKSHPQVGLVGSHFEYTDKNLTVTSVKKHFTKTSTIKKKILHFPACHWPTVMFKKSVFENVGGLNESLTGTDDIDFYFKVANITDISNVDKVLLKYRVFDRNLSRIKKNYQGIYCVIKAVNEYGYTMSLLDWSYFIFHNFLYVLPIKLEHFIIEIVRRLRKYI